MDAFDRDGAHMLLEVSNACDEMGERVAGFIAQRHPELDREAIGRAAASEIFACVSDVTQLANIEAEQFMARRRSA